MNTNVTIIDETGHMPTREEMAAAIRRCQEVVARNHGCGVHPIHPTPRQMQDIANWAKSEEAKEMRSQIQDEIHAEPAKTTPLGDRPVNYIFRGDRWPVFFDRITPPKRVVINGRLVQLRPKSATTHEVGPLDAELDRELLQAADEVAANDYMKCPEIPVRKGKRIIGWTWETPERSAITKARERQEADLRRASHKASRRMLKLKKASRKANRK